MKITVYFNDDSILECEQVVDSRKFWRYVSKHCNYTRRHFDYTLRVIKVYKEVL